MDTSVVKGLKVLEVLALSDGPRGVADLARTLGLSKSSMHRLLSTLTACGYARRDEALGTYVADIKLWRLGAAIASRLDVRQVAAVHLRRLRDATQETAHLAVLDGRHMVYIDRVESQQYVRTYSRIGTPGPAHCTGTGKVLLAASPKSVLADVAAHAEAFTPRTITGAAALTAEIARVRRQGYAVTREEWRKGVWSLAAPIVDAEGHVVAAVGVSGPADRMKRGLTASMRPAVLSAAAAISADLGAPVTKPARRVCKAA